MLDFHKLTLQDGPWMREILSRTHHMSCEYCFGNHYAWHRTYDARVCRINDYYIVALRNDEGENGISFGILPQSGNPFPHAQRGRSG